MNRNRLVFLVFAGLLVTGCQTVGRIAKNLDNLSEFRLPANTNLSEQGRMIVDSGQYAVGNVSSRRKTEDVGLDFWTGFFHALFDEGKGKVARYRVVDTIAVDGTEKYELATDYSITINKDDSDVSQGITNLTLRSLPDRKQVALRRTEQLGQEKLLEVDLPQTVKVGYYFNDLDRTGGWADVLRLPTGVSIKAAGGYAAILDVRYEHHLYYAADDTAAESYSLPLLLGAILFNADQVKHELVERTRNSGFLGK